MYSMYDAPSDRDYYEQFAEPEPEERCLDCGANDCEEHEENCEANRSAEEPQRGPNELPLISSGKKAVMMVIDGACSGNPGPGGWACLLRFGNHEREYSGHHPETTNNRMELEAAIQGFRRLKEACSVTVITDSQYVQRGMLEYLPRWKTNGWLRGNRDPVRNRDLWEVLDSLTQPHEVTWKWVRGHSGHPDQERCDRLANSHATSTGHQVQIA